MPDLLSHCIDTTAEQFNKATISIDKSSNRLIENALGTIDALSLEKWTALLTKFLGTISEQFDVLNSIEELLITVLPAIFGVAAYG